MKLKWTMMVGWLPVAFAVAYIGVQASTGANLRPSATLEINQDAGTRVLGASVDGNGVMLPSSEPVRPDMYQVTATVDGRRKTAWVRVKGESRTQVVITRTGVVVNPSDRLVMERESAFHPALPDAE